MLEFAEVFDLCLFDVPHFLYSHVFSVELAEEDGPLCATAHPLQVRDFLKGNLPGLYMQTNKSTKTNSVIKINDEITKSYTELTQALERSYLSNFHHTSQNL